MRKINWTTVSTIISTIVGLIASLGWKLYQNKKRETREITEQIIIPLVRSLHNLMSSSQSIVYRQGFYWFEYNNIERDKPHLLSKLPSDIKRALKEFNGNLREFNDKWERWVPHLEEIISSKIALWLTERGIIKERATNPKELLHSLYSWKFKGRITPEFVRFDTLILKDETLQSYISKSKKYPDDVIEKEEFVISGIPHLFWKGKTKREDFEEILKLIHEEIEKNSELKEDVESWRRVHKEIQSLIEILKSRFPIA